MLHLEQNVIFSQRRLPGCGRVELGATWLHGLAGNPLYDYAVEQGLMSATADQKGRTPEVADCPLRRAYGRAQ